MNNKVINNTNALGEKILNDFPRLDRDSIFTFECKPGISCFNKCCNDVNIFLTPYDIIRLRKKLGISSGEFLEKYTLIPLDENLHHPIVMLRMNDDGLNCPFVNNEGCTVYQDRPWSCRMYPVGLASTQADGNGVGQEFYFLLREEVCMGFENGIKKSVGQWMENQEIGKYNEFGGLFKDISLHEYFDSKKAIEPVKLEMFYMVCYDIDKFRSFLYESTFFKRFRVDRNLIEKMKNDDEELLRFGFKWLRYSLFGEKTLELIEDYTKPVAGRQFV